MCNVKAHSLYYGVSVLEIKLHISVCIGGVELACLFKACNSVNAFKAFFARYVAVFFADNIRNFFCTFFFEKRNYIVSYLVNNVNCTAARVENNVVAVEFILVYH